MLHVIFVSHARRLCLAWGHRPSAALAARAFRKSTESVWFVVATGACW